MKTISISNLMTTSGVGFGTSGARGLVSEMTDEVCYAYTKAFLQYLLQDIPPPTKGDSLHNIPPPDKGEARRGLKQVAIAGDLRPSTPRIITAVIQATKDMNIEPVNCGLIPSPAVALYGIKHQMPSIMVTGSHIPDDRNGIKFNTAQGEISKDDEQGIRQQSIKVDESMFDEQGMFIKKSSPPAKGETERGFSKSAETEYQQRYINLFGNEALKGMTVGIYQHSGVARDLLTDLLSDLGAKVIALGRSGTFIPVDTEAIRPEDIELAKKWVSEHELDAIVSTDGDADRPLISDENGNWLRGDGVGPLCAKFLGANFVVTPVSSNTAVDLSGWFSEVNRTRIGSPYVIAGMESMQQTGKTKIVGYEANGGFLQQDDIELNGKTLAALPTRDAVIVILSILISAKTQGLKVSELVEQLPERYTFSDRIKQIPTEKSQELITSFNTGDDEADGQAIADFFNGQFGNVSEINRTDGLRITFSNGDIVHLRPSGNAPELRCYTESDSLEKALSINQLAMKLVKNSI